MDINLIKELGLPVAGVLGLAWFVLYLIKWMQTALISGLLDRHNEVIRELNEVEQRVIDDNKEAKNILVKLIDNEKANEKTLGNLDSNLDTIIKFLKNGKH